jgi:hypothetical protein
VEKTAVIELPADAFDRWLDLQHRMLTEYYDPEAAKAEAIEILSPHWTHHPEPWERTEVVLKRTIMSKVLLAK